jgi:hypothetical protein
MKSLNLLVHTEHIPASRSVTETFRGRTWSTSSTTTRPCACTAMITDSRPMSISSHYRAIDSAKTGDTRAIVLSRRLLYDYVHEAPLFKLLQLRFTAVMASLSELSELQATSMGRPRKCKRLIAVVRLRGLDGSCYRVV